MSKPISIIVGQTAIRAELNDTPTARAIIETLPIEAQANRWGAEIYFSIDAPVPLETEAREVVEAGELAYWPPGRAFCIFFGPTPASRGDEIRAASPVNIIGRIQGDLAGLDEVPDGASIVIERL
jgi:hypothetical protein